MTRTVAINAFIDRGAKEGRLSIAARIVWVAIFRHAADGRVSVSVPAIARSTGLSRRAVSRSMAELKSSGMLLARGGGPWSRRYRLSPVPNHERTESQK